MYWHVQINGVSWCESSHQDEIDRVYKTNSPWKFGKKIIVSSMSGYYANSGGPKLDDLVRCFRILDGKPELSEYSQTIQGQMSKDRFHRKYPFFISNDYMDIKVFGNDNGHVTFKRPDLVAQLNEIVFRCFPAHIPQDNQAA